MESGTFPHDLHLIGNRVGVYSKSSVVVQQTPVHQTLVLIHFADVLSRLGRYLVAIFDLLAGILFEGKFLGHMEINGII